MILRILILLRLAVSVLCLTAEQIEAERSGWSFNPNTQYHIQTDEGPERYFRFQTLNGQYRKEKRLADGTVIGTEGWLDPLGYLRLKDYIADHEGFRILKSKTIFVGKDRPMQDALTEAKKVPAQNGVLVRPRRPPNPFRQPETNDVAPLPGNDIASGYYSGSTVRPKVDEYHYRTNRPNYSTGSSRGSDHNRNNYYDTTQPPRILQPPSFRSGVISRSSADYPPYDGIHSTANGFQYYLRRQYHEEESEPTGDSVGSFGYIDPFGIRRVVYYKADPENGFLHKKNNRYVGFAATPYDPSPPDLSRRRGRSSITSQ